MLQIIQIINAHPKLNDLNHLSFNTKRILVRANLVIFIRLCIFNWIVWALKSIDDKMIHISHYNTNDTFINIVPQVLHGAEGHLFTNQFSVLLT